MMEPRHFVACASFKTSGSRIFLAFTRPDDELDANDQSQGEEIDVFHVDARRWSRELISEASSDSTYKAAMEDCIYFFNRELLLYQLNTSGMTYVRLPAAKDDESWPEGDNPQVFRLGDKLLAFANENVYQVDVFNLEEG